MRQSAVTKGKERICPQCGARFECRASAERWCAKFPAIGAIEPASDCLCPACLARACREKEGFTLVELLVVIAIVAVLAGLLLPTLGRSKQSAQSTKCVNNLRQSGLCAQMYWQDNSGWAFPYEGIQRNNGQVFWFGWIANGAEETRGFDPTQGALYPCLGAAVGLCPSFDYSSSQFKRKALVLTCEYGYNLSLSPFRMPPVNMKDICQPSQLALLADAAQVNTFEKPASATNPMFEEWYYINNDSSEPNGQFRHNQRANVVFCDGHVAREAMVPGTLDARLPNEQIGWLRADILTLQK